MADTALATPPAAAAAAAASPDFLRRVLWWVGILCITYGCIRAINIVVYSMVMGGAYWFLINGGSRSLRHVEWGLRGAFVLSAAAMIVGGWALAARRSWGRNVLTIWVVLEVVTTLFSYVVTFYGWTWNQLRGATTRPSYPGSSLTFQAWQMLALFIEHVAFPLLVGAILFQPEVAKLWARSAGSGFAVIPLQESHPLALERERQ